MNFIFSILIVILLILLFTIVAAWIDRCGQKDKEEFIDKAIEKVLDKVSATVTSGIAMAKDMDKMGPVVKDSEPHDMIYTILFTRVLKFMRWEEKVEVINYPSK